MNPHQKNKIDISKLSADEQRLFRLYGKLPNKKDLLQNKLKERKYFDSGDYALSKAGKASDTGVTTIGTEHPKAEEIPHMSPLNHTISRSDSIAPGNPGALATSPDSLGHSAQLPPVGGGGPGGIHRGSINGIPGGGLPGATSRSPVKESSFLARSASMDEHDGNQQQGKDNILEGSVSPPVQKAGIPIRR
ncbi:hypothetical protein AYO21_10969 [Fonsecaea monophora]|uniref:mRNA stability protein n=1 Tax=Fonsecaea monophora TaxID=254056 RepID=A0A177ES92_9EURO|nr:hypothetical protein AYO21_10969 [Fonsecaea monophora]KAH0842835.1 putative cAMP-regulated phosphoprotein family protein Igo1 [Fonsecaea pedrosoi]OAG34864.1 hypothetical protein AYO21_10969 [Fonsecaea monophora]